MAAKNPGLEVTLKNVGFLFFFKPKNLPKFKFQFF